MITFFNGKLFCLQEQKEYVNGERVVFSGRTQKGVNCFTPPEVALKHHKKPYIYASKNKAMCFYFAVKRKVEDVGISISPCGKVVIYELYDGAFETRFRNKWTCIYKFNAKDFKMETEPHEVVCDRAVTPLECEYIEDCEKYLLEMEKNKQVIIKRYNNCSRLTKARYKKQLKEQIKKSLNFTHLSEGDYKKLSKQDKLAYEIKKER